MAEISARIQHMILGGIAGLALWVLFEILPDFIESERLLLWIGAVLCAFAAQVLMFYGMFKTQTVLGVSAAVAVIVGSLLTWNSLRHFELEHLVENGAGPIAVVLVVLSAPFILSKFHAEKGWTNYEALHDGAWGLLVRGIAAGAFTGLFWAIYFLCNVLLGMVGLDILEWLANEPLFPAITTGAVFGLALAVLYELQSVISSLRRLVILLLRLLLPPITVVSAVFLAMVPFQGLGAIFDWFSAAATMMAVAIAGVTFIAAVIDANAQDGSDNPIMTICVKIMSVLLVPLACLAIYAIWVRVAQYGWTPMRLMAALIALVVLGYALGAIWAVAFGKAQWADRIRQVFSGVAIGVLALGVLWMSPILNAERISANSQFARFEAGLIEPEELSVWELHRAWGKPGRAVFEKIKAQAEEGSDLAARLAQAETANNRWDVRTQNAQIETANKVEEVLQILPVIPEGQSLDADYFDGFGSIHEVQNACRRVLETGQPACVAIKADFDGTGRDQAQLVFAPSPNRYLKMLLIKGGDNRNRWPLGSITRSAEENYADALVIAIQSGNYALKPSPMSDLEITTPEETRTLKTLIQD